MTFGAQNSHAIGIGSGLFAQAQDRKTIGQTNKTKPYFGMESNGQNFKSNRVDVVANKGSRLPK